MPADPASERASGLNQRRLLLAGARPLYTGERESGRLARPARAIVPAAVRAYYLYPPPRHRSSWAPRRVSVMRQIHDSQSADRQRRHSLTDESPRRFIEVAVYNLRNTGEDRRRLIGPAAVRS